MFSRDQSAPSIHLEGAVRVFFRSNGKKKTMQELEPDFPDSFTCCATPISPYKRLPQQLLRLYVIKLDGSRFVVKVWKTATVAELKEAVEEVFSRAPLDRHIKISWSHVWGHFYLCFKGQKLIDNKAYIRLYGIKDEDQLHFVQNQSSTNRPYKRRDGMLPIDSS